MTHLESGASSPRVVGIIPARMGSSRFPGKPLAPIAGLPMIEHIFRRASMNARFASVCVATCDEVIARAAEAFGCEALMTSSNHQRGTERVAEAAQRLEADIVVNIQGDEPLVTPEVFDDVLAPFEGDAGVECTNLMARLDSDAEHDARDNVKVVVDQRGFAMYFSREAIPGRHLGTRPLRVYRQIGLYAFSRHCLRRFLHLPPTPHEIAESCDMLRLLEHGYAIRMVETSVRLQSVDTPEDLRRAEAMMRADPLLASYAAPSRPDRHPEQAL